ncbi:MAG: FAD-dependent thymidylate synthase, partial [Ruminococcus sp.]|nr:FAD-dependent thymidylate synthase [Ruminococcus sp.]
MKVNLISHTPDPERLAATAAKLCYSSSDIDSLRDGLTEEKTRSFIDMLVSVGHESVMEHVSFTFGIEGISRACSHQLVRHRIASYSQKSQRYVNENGFE